MPLKIHYPKNNTKHKRRTLIIQGKCDNANNVTGVLTKGGAQIAGQKLTRHQKQWGYRYQGLAEGQYSFTATQVNSPTVTETIVFQIDPLPPPPPGTAPTINSPTDGSEVALVIYVVGGSNAAQQITAVEFSGNGQLVAGVITQQPDANGDWTAEIDATACSSGGGYSLTATNMSGIGVVNNLTIP